MIIQGLFFSGTPEYTCERSCIQDIQPPLPHTHAHMHNTHCSVEGLEIGDARQHGTGSTIESYDRIGRWETLRFTFGDAVSLSELRFSFFLSLLAEISHTESESAYFVECLGLWLSGLFSNHGSAEF